MMMMFPVQCPDPRRNLLLSARAWDQTGRGGEGRKGENSKAHAKRKRGERAESRKKKAI